MRKASFSNILVFSILDLALLAVHLHLCISLISPSRYPKVYNDFDTLVDLRAEGNLLRWVQKLGRVSLLRCIVSTGLDQFQRSIPFRDYLLECLPEELIQVLESVL